MSTPTTDKVRVGIIGAGIGSAHLGGLSKVAEAEVAAICDLNTERATALANSRDLSAQIYGDYREMFDKARLDAITIGLPNALHKPVAVAALEAGLHVFCEKPLAMSAEQGREIAAVVEKSGKKFMVSQVNRFREDSQFLKRAITAGELGDIYYARTGWLRKSGIPGYGTWFTAKEMSGGGPLIDIGVHMLDVAWWLCGAPRPIAVSGVTYARFGPRGKGLSGGARQVPRDGTFDVEDLALGIIRFEGGLTINLEVSWALHNRAGRQWCEIYGELGGGEWGDQPGLFHEVQGAPVTSTPELPPSDAWKGIMQHFVDSILHDTAPDPDVYQGIAVMKMLDGLYESAASGQEVTIG